MILSNLPSSSANQQFRRSIWLWYETIPDPLLKYTFHFRTLLKLFREIYYWERLKFEIPHYAAEVYAKEEDLRTLRENVLLVVRDYNRWESALCRGSGGGYCWSSRGFGTGCSAGPLGGLGSGGLLVLQGFEGQSPWWASKDLWENIYNRWAMSSGRDRVLVGVLRQTLISIDLEPLSGSFLYSKNLPTFITILTIDLTKFTYQDSGCIEHWRAWSV